MIIVMSNITNWLSFSASNKSEEFLRVLGHHGLALLLRVLEEVAQHVQYVLSLSPHRPTSKHTYLSSSDRRRFSRMLRTYRRCYERVDTLPSSLPFQDSSSIILSLLPVSTGSATRTAMVSRQSNAQRTDTPNPSVAVSPSQWREARGMLASRSRRRAQSTLSRCVLSTAVSQGSNRWESGRSAFSSRVQRQVKRVSSLSVSRSASQESPPWLELGESGLLWPLSLAEIECSFLNSRARHALSLFFQAYNSLIF